MNELENLEQYKFTSLNINYENLLDLVNTFDEGFVRDSLAEEKREVRIITSEHERLVQKYFVGNAINYSFWFDTYNSKYTKNHLSGSEAMWDVVKRNEQLLDANLLMNINTQSFRKLFGKMPLEDKRIKSLQEVGRVLIHDYDGKAINILHSADFDIEGIIELLSTKFEYWNDSHDGVCFYKRIQAFINNLLNDKECCQLINKRSINKMTILADYHIPKLFRYYHVFEYSDDLENKINNGILLESRSSEEMDIRVATLKVGNEILKRLNEKKIRITPTTLDGILWRKARKIDMPYHLCKSIWY